MNLTNEYKTYPMVIRVISFVLIITFIAQDIAWANPDAATYYNNKKSSQNNLAPTPFSNVKGSRERFFVATISQFIDDTIADTNIPADRFTQAALKALLDKHHIPYEESNVEVHILISQECVLRCYWDAEGRLLKEVVTKDIGSHPPSQRASASGKSNEKDTIPSQADEKSPSHNLELRLPLRWAIPMFLSGVASTTWIMVSARNAEIKGPLVIVAIMGPALLIAGAINTYLSLKDIVTKRLQDEVIPPSGPNKTTLHDDDTRSSASGKRGPRPEIASLLAELLVKEEGDVVSVVKKSGLSTSEIILFVKRNPWAIKLVRNWLVRLLVAYRTCPAIAEKIGVVKSKTIFDWVRDFDAKKAAVASLRQDLERDVGGRISPSLVRALVMSKKSSLQRLRFEKDDKGHIRFVWHPVHISENGRIRLWSQKATIWILREIGEMLKDL